MSKKKKKIKKENKEEEKVEVLDVNKGNLNKTFIPKKSSNVKAQTEEEKNEYEEDTVYTKQRNSQKQGTLDEWGDDEWDPT